MQTDPIGIKDDLNLYAYVSNDPVTKIDPKGEAGVPGGGMSSCKEQNCSPTTTSERALGDVATVAHATERTGLAAGATASANVGTGPAKTVPLSLAGKAVAEKVAHKAGSIGALADTAKGIGQLADGRPREAAKTGLELTERVAGAAAGAELGAALGGPYAEITAPLGAIVGSFAPNAMSGVNDAIVNSHPVDAATGAMGGAIEVGKDFYSQFTRIK